MFVLLQVSPPEAAGHEDWCCCLDVIAVDASEAALRQYLAVYEPRYRAAVAAFDLWDADLAKDWGAEHDRVHDEFLVKYDGHGDRRGSVAAIFPRRSTISARLHRSLATSK